MTRTKLLRFEGACHTEKTERKPEQGCKVKEWRKGSLRRVGKVLPMLKLGKP